jgi:hypothetical protein
MSFRARQVSEEKLKTQERQNVYLSILPHHQPSRETSAHRENVANLELLVRDKHSEFDFGTIACHSVAVHEALLVAPLQLEVLVFPVVKFPRHPATSRFFAAFDVFGFVLSVTKVGLIVAQRLLEEHVVENFGIDCRFRIGLGNVGRVDGGIDQVLFREEGAKGIIVFFGQVLTGDDSAVEEFLVLSHRQFRALVER